MLQIPNRICFWLRYIYKEHYFATHYSCGFEQRQVSAWGIRDTVYCWVFRPRQEEGEHAVSGAGDTIKWFLKKSKCTDQSFEGSSDTYLLCSFIRHLYFNAQRAAGLLLYWISGRTSTVKSIQDGLSRAHWILWLTGVLFKYKITLKSVSRCWAQLCEKTVWV